MFSEMRHHTVQWKCLTFNRLRSIILQNIELLISMSVRTPNPRISYWTHLPQQALECPPRRNNSVLKKKTPHWPAKCCQRWRLQLRDQGYDNVLPGKGCNILRGDNDTCIWNTGGKMISRGNLKKLWEKPAPVPPSSTTNLTWSHPGLNPDLCSEKQAVNLLKLILLYCYL
jgi:hypothetical protein